MKSSPIAYMHCVICRDAKNYKAIQENRLSTKTDKLVVGLIVLAFAAILFGDAVLTTVDPASQLFSLNDVKGIVGFALIGIAAFYFKAAAK